MKSRLGASIAPLFPGECCGSICKALTLKPKFDLVHDSCHRYRHLLQGFQSSTRSLHSFAEEQDDFSELGPVMPQGRITLPKLVTEKPEHYLKSFPSKNASVSGAHLTMKSVLQTLRRSSPASCPKPENNHNPDTVSNHRKGAYNFNGSNSVSIENVPTKENLAPENNHNPDTISNHRKGVHNFNGSNSVSIDNVPATVNLAPENNYNPDTISNHRKGVYNFNGSNSVSIENVPSTVNLSQLIDAVSVFGEISSARMRTLRGGLSCCDVEFENESSSRRAALVGVANVRSNRLPIRPLHAQETCAIRIQSISKKTTDPAIHSLCKSIGALEGLARAGENAVDAIFSMKNNPDIQAILAKLNNTFVDNCKWSACLLSGTSSSVGKSKCNRAKSEMLSGIDGCLEAVKANHNMQKIHIEDLQYLHMLVMHLEGM